MSKYQPLADFLRQQKSSEWTASFADVEAVLGFDLPNSAHRYPPWWANQSGPGHSQTHGWQSVGWKTAGLDLAAKRIRFERERAKPEPDGAPPRADEDSSGERALLVKARSLTGIADDGELRREALKALIARHLALSLANLGGTMPDYAAPARERP